MNTIIFRTVAPFITALMLIYSIFVLLRGHNEPGGGFIGGLIAASAIAIFGISNGVAPVRRAIRFDPMSYAGLGLFLGALAGIPSYFSGVPFLTGLWIYPVLFEQEIALSTPLIFDIGVFLVVFGSLSSIALTLEERA